MSCVGRLCKDYLYLYNSLPLIPTPPLIATNAKDAKDGTVRVDKSILSAEMPQNTARRRGATPGGGRVDMSTRHSSDRNRAGGIHPQRRKP